jgi:hypothetical protein
MVYCSHLRIIVRLLSVFTLLFVIYSTFESFHIPYFFALKKTQASNQIQVRNHSALSQKLPEQSFYLDREIPTDLCPSVSPKLSKVFRDFILHHYSITLNTTYRTPKPATIIQYLPKVGEWKRAHERTLWRKVFFLGDPKDPIFVRTRRFFFRSHYG